MFVAHSRDACRRVLVLSCLLISLAASFGLSAATVAISGKPVTAMYVGQMYYFKPGVTVTSGKTVRFEIQGKPSWAEFDTRTGVLKGTPGKSHVGAYQNIRISVTDGASWASLPAFPITVLAASSTSSPAPAPTVTISGKPVTAMYVGQLYYFKPTATTSSGKTLRFEIQGKPSWAEFNTQTGALTGVAGQSHVGTHQNILISVTDGSSRASLPAFPITVLASSSNPSSAPAPASTVSISGKPVTAMYVGQLYYFKPTATTSSGKTLRFEIQGKPAWAEFNTQTGVLKGTPGPEHLGAHQNIQISATDGVSRASLPTFIITVLGSQSGGGSATVSWIPPTTNEDGTALVNLAGYRIYSGTSATSLKLLASINQPGLTRYFVESLASGRHYFAMTAVNSEGIESELSEIASILIP